jgi:hypothetical protein
MKTGRHRGRYCDRTHTMRGHFSRYDRVNLVIDRRVRTFFTPSTYAGLFDVGIRNMED